VTISEGIGAAILAHGQLIMGQLGLAGEFGHIPLYSDGLLCGCGRKGCLEMYASSRAAIGYYAELEPSALRPTIVELLNLAEDGDESALQALSRQAMHLGQGLRIITTVLSPEVILLTGGLTASWKRFGPLVEAELTNNLLVGAHPRIVITGDMEMARLRGAAALVLQRHTGYSGAQSSETGRRKKPAKTVKQAGGINK
jgi:predicted NBD/HSP70 family sugar kinase